MTSRTSHKPKSVTNLLALLDEVALSEAATTFEFIPLSALKSQGALAKFTLPDRQIVGMSLNTLKKLAEDDINIGFKRLDEARQSALELLEHRRLQSARQMRRTKTSLQEQLDEANRQARLFREDLTHLTRTLQFAINRMRDYAANRPEMETRLASDLREIYGRLSLARVGLRLVQTE